MSQPTTPGMPGAFSQQAPGQQPPVEPEQTVTVEPEPEPQACSHCGRNDPRHLKYVAKYGVCTA